MLADMITLRSSFSWGDVVGMMACLSDILPDLLLLGSNVNINGLNTFGITATLKEGVDPSDKIGGKDIRVNHRLCPDADLFRPEIFIQQIKCCGK